MSSFVTLDRATAADRPPASLRTAFLRNDDRRMLKAAAELTRDLNDPRPLIYWADMLGSAVLGYAALATAILAASPLLAVAAAIVAVLALYRAGLFIHEITHVKHSALPGFRLAWNAVIGIPLLVPSFMYEGIHTLHHARTRYGTAEDPEYLPLALMRPWTLPLFVAAALLGPVALLFRFAVLAPLSLLSPRLRELVVGRYSGLQINPSFRRRLPDDDLRGRWRAQEIAASLWAITLVGLVVAGIIPLRAFAIALGVASGIMLLNQIRTLVAHLWENEGEAMTVTAQFLDSVNVPPPGLLPALWAPVGLRFHALHHLLPGLPYHSLGQAHRRLTAELGETSAYHHASYAGLPALVGRLAVSSWRSGRSI